MQVAKRWRSFGWLTWALCGCASDREPPESENQPAAAAPSAQVAAATGTALAPAPTSTTSATAPAATPAELGDRIYAKARFVWIQRAPAGGRGWIGFLTLGGSVRLFEGDREKAKTVGPGCDAWYRVEPMGYVCLGPETTLDPADPVLAAVVRHAGDQSSPFPFEYGESIGAPRYRALPSLKEQRGREWDLAVHQEKLATLRGGGTLGKDDELYRGLDLTPAGVPFPELPHIGALAQEARDRVVRGSTIAWSKAYDDGAGRTWLYTSDHMLVPKDRVKAYPKAQFQGVTLGPDKTLPIAFFRKKDRDKLRRVGDGFEPTGATFPRLSHVGLTGAREQRGKEVFLETREPGVWVRESDAAVAALRSELPFREDELGAGRNTWVDVSVMGGTFVAYEGRTPVFATLIAPGRGGIPYPGKDPISTASTPTGTFRVDGKFRWATMVSSTDDTVVHAEVQYVQNFHGAHALHGAYWHDQWGELKSGGCVNLSPLDSKRVFEWTEPALPPGWHGARSIKELGPSTRVVVRP